MDLLFRCLTVAKLVRVLDLPTACATTAEQRSVAGKGRLDGGMAFGCLCEGKCGCVNRRDAATEPPRDELDAEMVCCANHAEDVEEDFVGDLVERVERGSHRWDILTLGDKLSEERGDWGNLKIYIYSRVATM